MKTTDAKPDIREVPIYSIGQAAHNLGMSSATLRSWVVGRTYPTLAGTTVSEPLIRLPGSEDRRLSFTNLVEAHVLLAIRRIHDVSMPKVRAALAYSEESLGIDRLLVRQDLLTAGGDLFLRRMGELINLSQSGQLAMKKILEIYLKRVQRDPAGWPARLFPIVPTQGPDTSRTIVIDPRISFGRPVVANSGVGTAVIVDRFNAGESVEELADDYHMTEAEVEEAILFESAA